ncbi:MAG: TipAS antibiotic-recognition domain-containing protein [Sporichthyaceae bacterium]
MGQYAAETERRWGQTEAWRESARRAAGYTPDHWSLIKAEAAASVVAFAEAMREGCAPDAGAALLAAEDHRQHLTRWFYDVDPQMHRKLAKLYLADPRFAGNYESVAPGLAQYVHDAIHANAERLDDA